MKKIKGNVIRARFYYCRSVTYYVCRRLVLLSFSLYLLMLMLPLMLPLMIALLPVWRL